MDFEMLKAAIKEIAGNHNLSEKVVVASLESAIEKAYLREIRTPDAEVKVGLDMETGLITVAQLKLVRKDEEIEDDALEIDYDAAKEDATLFLENLEEEKEDALKESQDFLTSAALKQVADANKRELTARERSGMMEALAAAESLLRDALVRSEGVDEDIVNDDAAATVDRIAAASDTPAVLRALDAVARAADDLSHNVSPQLTLEVMLLRIKEALACPPSSR